MQLLFKIIKGNSEKFTFYSIHVHAILDTFMLRDFCCNVKVGNFNYQYWQFQMSIRQKWN